MFTTIHLDTEGEFQDADTKLEDKVFKFVKQKHAAEFVKICEAIEKFIAVNYNNSGP